MNRTNRDARERSLVVTAFDACLTATIERNSLGYARPGDALTDFVVEAVGVVRATHDGAVDVTISFHRGTSAFQILWRLIVVLLIAVSVWTLIDGPLVPVLSVAFGVGILPLVLLWSLRVYIQGMRQAGRDRRAVLDLFQTALGSHTVEHA